MKEEILRWLSSGCSVKDGIRLLESYSKNAFLVRMVKANPTRNLQTMIKELSSLASLTTGTFVSFTCNSSEVIQPQQKSLREEFPFLKDPDCPLELRALVTDKFSSYYRYRELHSGLKDCVNAAQCADACRSLIDNYQENRAIYAELDYYQRHKVVLGKHPIFRHFNKMRSLRKLGTKELVRKQIQLEHNIWRIESEIKKKDKPHLETERRVRLSQKQAELSEVNRLLG